MLNQLHYDACQRTLAKHGLKLAPAYILSAATLEKVANKLPYPAVVKVFSQQVLHKNKEGFVRTGIMDAKALKEAFRYFEARMKKRKIKGSIITQKETKGIELILGAKQDPTFGPVVLLGLGGIYTEALNRVSMRIAPLSRSLAEEMIAELNLPALDMHRNALVNVLLKVSKLSEKEKIAEMDLNPVIVNENGLHLVDVRMMQ